MVHSDPPSKSITSKRHLLDASDEAFRKYLSYLIAVGYCDITGAKSMRLKSGASIPSHAGTPYDGSIKVRKHTAGMYV